MGHVLEALRDPKYWVIAVSVVAFSVANAGVTNFNPLIISGYGFSKTKTTLMAAPQAAVAIVAQVSAAAAMLYIPRVRCLMWIISCFPAMVGTIMIHSETSLKCLCNRAADTFIQLWTSRNTERLRLSGCTCSAFTTCPRSLSSA